jgi:hypothetical protein
MGYWSIGALARGSNTQLFHYSRCAASRLSASTDSVKTPLMVSFACAQDRLMTNGRAISNSAGFPFSASSKGS